LNHIRQTRNSPELSLVGFAVIFPEQLGDEAMKQAIQELRHLADECESRAKLAADLESQVNLIILATNCHWLAGKAEQIKASRTVRT